MKQEHPFISIVTCNRPEQLAVCLRACGRLDYPHDRFEVIVVDDGEVMPLDEVVNQVQGLPAQTPTTTKRWPCGGTK